MSIESTIEEAVETTDQYLGRIWKTIAALGVVSIAFGVVMLVWPDLGLSTMTALVGAYALVWGCMAAYAAFKLPSEAGRLRLWVAFESLLGLAVGIGVLVWPDLSAKALLYAIAIWAIIAGVRLAVGAIVFPLRAGESILLGLGGIILASYGVIMFVEPGDGAVALLALVASFAIVAGIFELAFAREIHNATEELKQRTGPTVRPKPVVGA